MKTDVKVPSRLLLDHDLPATAKLLWLVLQLAPPECGTHTPGLLQAKSGLARHTVLRSLSLLEAGGWLNSRPSGPCVTLPSDLITDRRIGAREKVLYGWLQLTPGFQALGGETTYQSLSLLGGMSRNPVKQAMRLLATAGWVQTVQKNAHQPIQFTLHNPFVTQRETALARVKRRLRDASFKGEALMREFLSLVVDSDEYEDNASPGYLINPYTDEQLQFDRYYPPSVAFEFNGSQHYVTTDHYPHADLLKKQQARDYIKRGICEARSIKLVVLHAEDLTLARMQQRVSSLLPLRNLVGQEKLITYLEAASKAYRQKAAQLMDRVHPTA